MNKKVKRTINRILVGIAFAMGVAVLYMAISGANVEATTKINVLGIAVVLKNAFLGNIKNLHPILGNYIIMECENGIYAFFAHLKKDSIIFSVDGNIKKGQILRQVGHSGNSTGAHLHFQLMDSSNLLEAKGIPCVFEKYEVYNGNSWKYVYNSIPTDSDRIRYNG